MQHNLIDFKTTISMLITITNNPTIPIIQIPKNEPNIINQILDTNTHVIIVPIIKNTTKTTTTITAYRYTPTKKHNYNPNHATHLSKNTNPTQLDAHAMCLVMIESRATLDAINDIYAIPNLNNIYIKPTNLTISLNIPLTNSQTSKTHQTTTTQNLKTTQTRDLTTNHHNISNTHAQNLITHGFDIITITTNIIYLTSKTHRELNITHNQN